MTGSLVSIVYKPDVVSAADASQAYRRLPVERAQLRAGHGLVGDRKAGRGPRRQLNFLLSAWLEARRSEGYQAAPGAFGEQVIIAGLDDAGWTSGTRLRIGPSALVEVTMPRIGCARLQRAQARRDALLLGGIGYLARVVASGLIAIGDDVVLS